MKSKEERFLELMSSIDIDNPVMDFDRYGNILFWFDNNGNHIYNYNIENGSIFFSYEKIWSFFKKKYDLNYTDIQTFMEGMVEHYFKFKDVTAHSHSRNTAQWVEQHFKLKDVTPHTHYL